MGVTEIRLRPEKFWGEVTLGTSVEKGHLQATGSVLFCRVNQIRRLTTAVMSEAAYRKNQYGNLSGPREVSS